MQKVPWWVHPALLTAGLFYGGNYRVAKEVLDHFMGPFGLNLLRVVTAVVVFWLVGSIKHEKIEQGDYGRLLLCALFGTSLNITLFFKGLSYTTPVNAALILTTLPIFVLVVSYLLMREKIGFFQVAGVIFGLAGAFLLVQTDQVSFADKSLLGDAMVLLNTVSYALYLVLVKPLMAKYHAFTVLKWLFLMGLLIIAPLGYEQLLAIELSSLTSFGAMALLYVAFATTVFAYFLNVSGIKYVSSAIVGYYIYLQPLFAGFIDVIIGEQTLNVHLIVSAGLIFTGVFLVSNPKLQIKKS